MAEGLNSSELSPSATLSYASRRNGPFLNKRALALMKFEEITSNQQELATFEARGRTLWGGFPIPAGYATQGRTFALYRDGAMIGGFMLILEGPLRTFAGISEETRQRLLRNKRPEEFLEAYAVWLDPAEKSKRTRVRFWAKATYEALHSGRKYMILGYNGSSRGLRRFWERAGFSLVERIDVVSDRFNSHNSVEIVCARTTNILTGYMRYCLRTLFPDSWSRMQVI